ncbi:MAG: hypothetical protein M1828_004817 [Chrysothrix sp. TS-e1954]|nr:MAG: hypothetical protein M1828_004817 [Chrysothrix sp. TS-e1954]
MASVGAFDVYEARNHFPALQNDSQVFFDNAGGTQILKEAVEGVRRYLLSTNVQLGASYRVGQQSTQLCNEGIRAASQYINADDDDEIVIGPSTTQLFRNLSVSLRPHFPPGSEIVLSNVDHEANLAPWVTLAEDLNLTIKWWKGEEVASEPPRSSSSNASRASSSHRSNSIDAAAGPPPKNPHLTPRSLKPLLSDRTRLVACTHASNILGTINLIRAIADTIHTSCPAALLCVDGVAYAPHRPVDVKDLGVDIYAFSWYKLFGPHIAQLYVSRAVQDRPNCMRSLGHYFKPGDTLEEKLGLAGSSYELVAPLPSVVRYLNAQGWEGMTLHEGKLQKTLLRYLRSKPQHYAIMGEADSDTNKRVSVVSFAVKNRSTKEVVEAVEAKAGSKRVQYGFRWGHFYAKRLMEGVLGLDGNEGVCRVSMVHYNTVGEVDGFVRVLDGVVVGTM